MKKKVEKTKKTKDNSERLTKKAQITKNQKPITTKKEQVAKQKNKNMQSQPLIKSQKIDIATRVLFILLEIAIFALVFLSSGDMHKLACFAAVINPFAYSLKFLSKEKVSIYTQLGLMFTVFADLFLVVIEPQFKTIGMAFFAITQFFYFLRLLSLSKHKKVHIVLRMLFSIGFIVATFLVLKDSVNALSVISIFYYGNLILNLLCAIGQIKKSPLFALGLFLFLLCDTVIGLQMAAGSYISVQPNSIIYNLINIPFNLAWMFYIPSQGFIAYSLHNKNK